MKIKITEKHRKKIRPILDACVCACIELREAETVYDNARTSDDARDAWERLTTLRMDAASLGKMALDAIEYGGMPPGFPK